MDDRWMKTDTPPGYPRFRSGTQKSDMHIYVGSSRYSGQDPSGCCRLAQATIPSQENKAVRRDVSQPSLLPAIRIPPDQRGIERVGEDVGNF